MQLKEVLLLAQCAVLAAAYGQHKLGARDDGQVIQSGRSYNVSNTTTTSSESTTTDTSTSDTTSTTTILTTLTSTVDTSTSSDETESTSLTSEGKSATDATQNDPTSSIAESTSTAADTSSESTDAATTDADTETDTETSQSKDGKSKSTDAPYPTGSANSTASGTGTGKLKGTGASSPASDTTDSSAASTTDSAASTTDSTVSTSLPIYYTSATTTGLPLYMTKTNSSSGVPAYMTPGRVLFNFTAPVNLSSAKPTGLPAYMTPGRVVFNYTMPANVSRPSATSLPSNRTANADATSTICGMAGSFVTPPSYAIKADSIDACKAACDARGGSCKAFEAGTVDGDGNNCWLFEHALADMELGGVQSGFSWNFYDRECDVSSRCGLQGSFITEPIRGLNVESLSACQAQCKGDSACKTFEAGTLDGNDQNCWLFDTDINSLNMGASTTGWQWAFFDKDCSLP